VAVGFDNPDTENAVEPEKGFSRFPFDVTKLRESSWANREELVL
jgi:hypothetical protein